jgi:hypothetical protein
LAKDSEQITQSKRSSYATRAWCEARIVPILTTHY